MRVSCKSEFGFAGDKLQLKHGQLLKIASKLKYFAGWFTFNLLLTCTVHCVQHCFVLFSVCCCMCVSFAAIKQNKMSSYFASVAFHVKKVIRDTASVLPLQIQILVSVFNALKLIVISSTYIAFIVQTLWE